MSTATCPVHHQQQGGGRGGRRPIISFSRMVNRVARRHGTEAAVRWTRAVLGHQAAIDEAVLRSAVASRNLKAIEAAVRSSALQQVTQKAVQGPLHSAVVAGGHGSAETLAAEGLAVTFNAAHPNVALQAQLIAAQLVVDVPKDTKAVIAEVVALGSQQGLTTAQQARAIREVVGLPPNWAQAPLRLADEIRAGQVSRATGRRLSGRAKQQIRSRVARGTVTPSFVQRMQSEYTRSLINRRARNIARTESLRAAHAGLHESWAQGMQQGVIPRNARRFWLVTPDSRLSPEHARIPRMNPNGRGMREPFFTPDGSFLYPPSRPNCRCSVGLSVARRGEVREPIVGEGGVIFGEDIVPVGPTAAPPSEVLGGSMQRMSQGFVQKDVEWAAVWDAEGNIITRTTSRQRHSVSVQRSAWRKAKDGRFTHNHPSGGSFSFTDIENAVKYDIKEKWAVSTGDSFRVVRPEGGWPSWMSIEAKYKQVEQSMRVARQATGIRAGSAQWAELERRFTHDVWQNVFRDIGARYERFSLATGEVVAPRVAVPKAFKNRSLRTAVTPEAELALTGLEKNAIRSYTSHNYTNINEHLRRVVELPRSRIAWVEGEVAQLDAVMTRSRLTADTMLYRGGRLDEDLLVVGSVFEDLGFVSTSTKQKAAMEFVSPRKNVLFYIQVPEGTAGLGITRNLGMKPVEAEVLLNRGLRFRVVQVFDERTLPNGQKFREVVLEVVP